MSTLGSNRRLRDCLLAVVLVGLLGMKPVSAQLPPVIQADRFLVQAERDIGNGDYEAALATLDKILALQETQSLEIPASFWFKHSHVSHEAGSHARAVESAIRYLETTGQSGEHYVEALNLLDVAEEAQRQAEAARRQAEAARQQAIAAARREAEEERLRAEAEQQKLEELALQNEELARRQIELSKVPLRDSLDSGGSAPEMARIASGRFCAPTDVYGNCEWVSIPRSFAISKFEVTRGEFREFVNSSRYRTEAESRPRYGCNDLNTRWSAKNSSLTWKRPGFSQSDDHPVVCVSFADAKAYASWLTNQTGHRYRLPSVIEWLYAARAGSMWAMLMPNFEELNRIRWPETHFCKFANIGNGRHTDSNDCDGARYTVEVGEKEPNNVGLYNIVGNVSELVDQCYNSGSLNYYSFDSIKPATSCAKGVSLGNSWDDSEVLSSTLPYTLPKKEGIYVKPHSVLGGIDRNRTVYRRSSYTSIGFRVVRGDL